MRLAQHASRLYDATLSVLYPQPCAVCGRQVESRDDGHICSGCWARTRLFSKDELACWKCGRQAPGRLIQEQHRQAVRCHRCDDEEFAAARACGAYEGALRAAVLGLKREPHVSGRLARILFEVQQGEPLSMATRVIPVPLHSERERDRGFNQAAVLARALARLSRLPLDERSLVRTLHSERHRAGMDARSRRESVAGAFQVERPRLIENEVVLLVDDVFTTGATVSACAHALKEAGALEVFVLTVARAV